MQSIADRIVREIKATGNFSTFFTKEENGTIRVIAIPIADVKKPHIGDWEWEDNQYLVMTSAF